ncbi:MAG: hypothetical protein MUP85_09500, partial [Candidatus Lokiarchaeota archaeon]|nr:hypothetical protein [Candidatus Lokiarchaeota archaeon]
FSITFYKDQATTNCFIINLGESEDIEFEISQLEEGRHAVEISFENQNSVETWNFFIDGVCQTGLSISGVTLLYPIITIEAGSLEILEVKNQIFNKVNSTNWAENYNDSEIIDFSEVGAASNGITYSRNSLNREIIYCFNENLHDIDNMFEDLLLYSDLEFNSQDTFNNGQFDPEFELLSWNNPKSTYYINYFAQSVKESNELVIDGSPQPIGYNGYTAPYCSRYNDNMWTREGLGWFFTNTLWMRFDFPGITNKIYIADIDFDYEFRSICDGDLTHKDVAINFVDVWAPPTYKMTINFPDGWREKYTPYLHENHQFDISPLSVYNYQDGYDYGTYGSVFPYTDSLQMNLVQVISRMDFGLNTIWKWLDVDSLVFKVEMSSQPVTFKDQIYNTNYDIPINQLNDFYVLKQDHTKYKINNEPNYNKTGQSLRQIVDSFDDIIQTNTFGKNTLNFGIKSNIACPKFIKNGDVITTINKINDFSIVPKLNNEEGKGKRYTSYPYQTSWYHQQELVSALPFNLEFSNLAPQDFTDLSEIRFQCEFNVSTMNFNKWSWRPFLKIYDAFSDKWRPYNGIIKIGEKILWDYQNDYLPNDGYDLIQLNHPPDSYFEINGSNEDICILEFILTKDAYPNLTDLLQYSDSSAYLALLGEICVIPGIPDDNQWDIDYEDYSPFFGRKEIHSQITIKNAFYREFRTTEIFQKNLYNSNDLYHGRPFEKPATSFLDLNFLLGNEAVKDIASIHTVFGIKKDSNILVPLQNHLWEYDGAHGQLLLSNEVLMNYDYFNFTMELWTDFISLGGGNFEPNKSKFENIVLIENVIGIRPDGSLDWFTKNFESGLSSYMDEEPYFIHLTDEGEIDYINFASWINISAYEIIRGVVSGIGSRGSESYDENVQLIHENMLRFPFNLNVTDDFEILNLTL